jgi:PAS domain S-box-containing protein
LFFAALTLFGINRMELLSNEVSLIYNHPLAVGNAALRIKVDTYKIHRDMKDVVLTRDQSEIDRLYAAVDEHEACVLRDFKIVSERFLGEREKYQAALGVFKAWRPIRDEVFTLMRSGRQAEAVEITKGKVARHLLKIEEAISVLDEFAEFKAADLLNTSGQAKNNARSIMIMLLLIAVLVCLGFAITLTRSITRPLEKLRGSTKKVGEGRLDTEIDIDSKDEIGELASSFDEMTRNLEQADRELKSEKEYLEKLHYSLGDAVFTVRMPERVIESVNRAAEDIFGYATDEFVGLETGVFYSDDSSYAAYDDKLRNALKRGETIVRAELLLKRKNGECFTGEVTTTFIMEGGELRRAISIVRDITERKQMEEELQLAYDGLEVIVVGRTMELTEANSRLKVEIAERKLAEEALKESEERYRSIFEYNVAGIAVADANNRLVKVNAAYCKMLGYTEEEALHLGVAEVTHPDDRSASVEAIGRLKRREVENIVHEKRYVRKDGSIIFAKVEVCALYDEEGRYSLGIATIEDITERKRSEEALRESEEKYRTLFEESKDVVFMSSADGKILDINSAGVELYGYASKEELLKIDVLKYSYRNPEDRERFKLEMDRNGFVRDFEVEVKKKNGDILTVLTTASAVLDDKGEVVAYRGIVRDITERKSLQQQLAQAQKMEAVGELTGGIAHDFRNILTIIQANAHILMKKIRRDDDLTTSVGLILKSSDKAANLIKGLLAFSRKQPVSLNPVNMNKIMTEVEPLLSMLTKEGIEFKISAGKENLTVMADKGQLEQVLVNLATNARDVMPNGGALTISLDSMELDYEFERLHPYFEPGRYCRITVQDTGTGMDAETKNKIFEPFFSTKGIGKGTGLGLSIVHGIIEQHNGHITVDSEVGKGTTFKLFLPLVVEEEEEEEEEVQQQIPLTGTETILLAEDDSDVREVTKLMIEEYGYKVIEAVDGADAIDKFKEFKDDIQLLVLDGIMPKKSGKEAFLSIRKINPEIKALFLSGYSYDIVDKDDNLADGTSYTLKPVSGVELSMKIRKLLDSSVFKV